MTSEDFPADLSQYITERISSVAQLEALLLLRSDPEKTWTAPEVEASLRTTPEMAAEQLAILQSEGIVIQPDSNVAEFRYSPTDKLRDLIDRLAAIYEERRVTVITMIYSKPVDKVRTFADAFRLRKED